MVDRIRRTIDKKDLEVRNYGVTTDISRSSFEKFNRPIEREKSEYFLEKLGDVGRCLVMRLFAIPGVAHVYIRPYEVEVTKGRAFNWREVEPAVIKAIKKVFEDTEQVEVEYGRPAPRRRRRSSKPLVT